MKLEKTVWIFLVVSAVLLCAGSTTAHNKVVVIPLIEDAPALEPWAPVAAVSPPNSAYTIGPTAVTDNVTGLIWQKTDDDTRRTWAAAWDYCTDNDPGLPGTGWRLPTKDELMSIVYYGTFSPAINSVAFPGTNSSYYWSVTTFANFSGGYAWILNFADGLFTYDIKTFTWYVRCVRGLPNRESLFENNGNGTVIDLATGLTWQRQDDDNTRNWNEAISYCQGLTLAGGGWRLPTIKELASIADYRVYNSAIDEDAFPGTDWAAYWSATADAQDSLSAWYVPFSYGYVFGASKTSIYTVRCVR